MKRINLKTAAALLAATGSLTFGGATALAAPAGAIVSSSGGGLNLCTSLAPKITVAAITHPSLPGLGSVVSGSCFTPSGTVTVSWSAGGVSGSVVQGASSTGAFTAQVGWNCGPAITVVATDNKTGTRVMATGPQACILY
jgi:hypothetical protein